MQTSLHEIQNGNVEAFPFLLVQTKKPVLLNMEKV